jgi:hypothetical protein
MPRTSNRGGRNNNPQGHNQYDSGWIDTARERPMATAAAAAAAVGAGVFLWSRRNQISDQISGLSNQISDWSQSMRSGSDNEMAMAGEDSAYEGSNRGTGTTSRRGMSETGGGNASLGARSGGGGTTSAPSGRGRAKSAATS